MSKILFVDIDGTIADNSERYAAAYAAGPERSPAWKAVIGNHARIASDRTYGRSAAAIHKLSASGYSIIYLTGRKKSETKETAHWLTANAFPAGTLVTGMYRKKAEYIRQYLADHVVEDAIFIDNDVVECSSAIKLVGDKVTVICIPHPASGRGTVLSDFWSAIL